MKTTLLIMAAGIGSRFGTGIKQLEPVDASNHIIMDYSIHDAIEAGFNISTSQFLDNLTSSIFTHTNVFDAVQILYRSSPLIPRNFLYSKTRSN